MSHWNYRILAHEYEDEVYLEVHAVYYDDNGNPLMYSENPSPVCSETIKGITRTLNRMSESRKKPILYAGEKFPTIYK